MQLLKLESLKRQIRIIFKHNPEVRHILLEWLKQQSTVDSVCPHCGKDVRKERESENGDKKR